MITLLKAVKEISDKDILRIALSVADRLWGPKMLSVKPKDFVWFEDNWFEEKSPHD